MLLRSSRLSVRELTPDDAGFIVELLNEPSFLHYIGDRGVRTHDDALEYIEMVGPASYRRHGAGLYAAVVHGEATPAGMCGIMRKDWLPGADLAYAFLPRYWSRGYALEAAAAMVEHGRSALALKRIHAVVTPGNAPSTRLLERLGFGLAGTVTEPTTGAELLLFDRALGTTPVPQVLPELDAEGGVAT